ncbi:hypothetical protein ACWF76_08935 [Streptomyces globisporus]
MTITSEQPTGHTFLALLYEDDYVPDHVLFERRAGRRWPWDGERRKVWE